MRVIRTKIQISTRCLMCNHMDFSHTQWLSSHDQNFRGAIPPLGSAAFVQCCHRCTADYPHHTSQVMVVVPLAWTDAYSKKFTTSRAVAMQNIK